MRQSWAPREMREGVVNADGFGFGWYAASDGEPAVYLNTCPAWTDPNLDVLCRVLESGTWLANVRSATPGQGLGHANTQPFTDGRVMFLHNGLIESFRERGRPRLHRWLLPEIQAGIRGETDSEFLFAVLRQCLRGSGDLASAFLEAVRVLPGILEGARVLFNVVCCDGENLFACRHALNGGVCPSLYVAENSTAFPGAVVIASEPLDDAPGWVGLEPHSWLSVRRGTITGRGTLPA
jgi:glutamine amidotransferase